MAKHTGLRRFLTKRFILVILTMGAFTVSHWYGKISEWPYIAGMLIAAAYHDGVSYIQAFKGIIPGVRDRDGDH